MFQYILFSFKKQVSHTKGDKCKKCMVKESKMPLQAWENDNDVFIIQ